MRKVLFVCHNHAAIRPGGVETYSLELCEAMRNSGRFEPLLLARARRPAQADGIAPAGLGDGQFFFHADHAGYDTFFGTPRDKTIITRHFAEFLDASRPDVVHFQHTLFLGFDLIRQARNTLPHAPIVYTLHEYGPICHHNGQMVRTEDLSLCPAASPHACHECFPDVSPQAFFVRKQFIQSHLELVDLFIAPSRFLRQRYIEWGIPADKIQFEEYGRQAAAVASPIDRPTAPHGRFAFFGQLTPFKGVTLLLQAMVRVGGDPTLVVHGANLEFQSKPFQQDFQALAAALGHRVTLAGEYDQAQLPQLMAGIDWVVVPSLWWENSPLVIQEAFLNRRPVICSDIGGMAEKVTDGVNGLHFRTGDAADLARVLHHASTTPGLWARLQRGVPEIHSMSAHVDMLDAAYTALLGRSAPRH